jgi:toxin ParE1/3/4
MLGENPLLYRLHPEIAPDARLVAHRRYVILYKIDGDVVRIIRIVHGAQDLPAAFGQTGP